MRNPVFFCDLFVRCDVRELQDPGVSLFFIADGGFLEGLDPAHRVGCLLHRLENIADAFAVHGLYVAVRCQLGDRPAHGVAGTAILPDERVFRGEHLLVGVHFGLDLFFQVFVNMVIDSFRHSKNPLFKHLFLL